MLLEGFNELDCDEQYQGKQHRHESQSLQYQLPRSTKRENHRSIGLSEIAATKGNQSVVENAHINSKTHLCGSKITEERRSN
jgi:hypothetical protein